MTVKIHIEKLVSELEVGDVVYVETGGGRSYVLYHVTSVDKHWKYEDVCVVRVISSKHPVPNQRFIFEWLGSSPVLTERYMKEPSDSTDIIA